jgi:hypothetical protein
MVAPSQHKPLVLEHTVGPREQPCPQGKKGPKWFQRATIPSSRKGVMLLQGVTMFLEEQMCLKFCMIVIFSYEF